MLTTPRRPRSFSGCAQSCRVSPGRHTCGGAARHQTGRGRAWAGLCGVDATTRQGSLPPSVGGIREGGINTSTGG
jgi:hypothetical protein